MLPRKEIFPVLLEVGDLSFVWEEKNVKGTASRARPYVCLSMRAQREPASQFCYVSITRRLSCARIMT